MLPSPGSIRCASRTRSRTLPPIGERILNRSCVPVEPTILWPFEGVPTVCQADLASSYRGLKAVTQMCAPGVNQTRFGTQSPARVADTGGMSYGLRTGLFLDRQ